MDNAMYVGLSRQMTLRRQLDIVANNVANADTAGFKVESLMFRTEADNKAGTRDGPRGVKFVLDDAVARDFGQGKLTETGGTFDLAIEGDGFFTVQTAEGERYTRDGRFTMAADGRLTTQAGAAVQGEGGDIVIDPALGPVSISADGIVSQAGQRLGRISVVRFDDMAGLTKGGDNLYANTSNLGAQAAPDAVVRQGMLETSNVNPIIQVTKLIEVSRAYESITRMMEQTAELSRRSVERMGKVS